jgi:hypothetical protein
MARGPLVAGRGPAGVRRRDAAKVPDHIIEALREREHKGVIELPRAPESRLRAGDHVRVSGGPFVGHLGLYAGMKPHERATAAGELTHTRGNLRLGDRPWRGRRPAVALFPLSKNDRLAKAPRSLTSSANDL